MVCINGTQNKSSSRLWTDLSSVRGFSIADCAGRTCWREGRRGAGMAGARGIDRRFGLHEAAHEATRGTGGGHLERLSWTVPSPEVVSIWGTTTPRVMFRFEGPIYATKHMKANSATVCLIIHLLKKNLTFQYKHKSRSMLLLFIWLAAHCALFMDALSGSHLQSK